MTRWKVVGGEAKGGIVVRTGEKLDSEVADDRLSHGAIVEELKLTDAGRLHYRHVSGTTRMGPVEGWVSVKLTGKDLLVRFGEVKLPTAKPETFTKAPEATMDDANSKQGLGRLNDRESVLAGGKHVVISGLASRPELNSTTGAIRNYDIKKQRFEVFVKVPGKQWPESLSLKPQSLEFTEAQIKLDSQARGDEIVLVGEVNLRDSMYEQRIDVQYLYDKAIDRVLSAEHEFAVLDLPARLETDTTLIRKQYRKISLGVHPDKNKHEQAGEAFRKVYGAFEILSDQLHQRKLLFKLGLLEGNFDDDDEDELFEWWWEANISEIDRAAAEAEGQDFDMIGQIWVSDGKGAKVEDVKWVSLDSARKLLEEDACIFIDCREPTEFCSGYIPGAWNCPMQAFMDHGVVKVLGPTRIGELLSAVRRAQPVVIYSSVATPFSRCRSLCRWLLRAGSSTLKAGRLKRLKGGMMGWTLRKHPVSRPLMDQPIPPDRMPRNANPQEKREITKQFRAAEKIREEQMDAPWVEKPDDGQDCTIA